MHGRRRRGEKRTGVGEKISFLPRGENKMCTSTTLSVLSGLLSLGCVCVDWTTASLVEHHYDSNHLESTQSDEASLERKRQPHIIFILTDDQGYNDIGYHNPSIKTPTLDKLAAEGVKLENYYVQPICTPSRSQLITGRYQIHTGLQHSIIRPRQPSCLPLHMDTLPQRLQQAGYATHMVGKWHLGFYRKACLPTRRGFDSFFGSLTGSVDYYSYGSCDGPGLCGYDLHADEAVAWGQEGRYSTLLYTQRVRKILEGHDPTAKPLFLLLSLQAVHTPLQPPKSYIYPYRDMTNIARRKFAAMVSTVDEAVHNVTYALRKYGYYRNSVIIYSTDNGAQPFTGGSNWPLRGRKGTYWEGGVRGVAFVHSPLLRRRRRVSKALLHITDWFPTLVGLAGGNISQSEGLDGYDVWDTLSEGKESPRLEILHNIDPLNRPPAPATTKGGTKTPPGKKKVAPVASKKALGPAPKKPKKVKKPQHKKGSRLGSESKATKKSQSHSQPRPKPKLKPKSKPLFKKKHLPKSKPLPKIKPLPKSKPLPKIKPLPKSKPLPKIKPLPKSKPLPKIKPLPKSKPLPKIKPLPKPKPPPKLKPLSKSKLKPKTKSQVYSESQPVSKYETLLKPQPIQPQSSSQNLSLSKPAWGNPQPQTTLHLNSQSSQTQSQYQNLSLSGPPQPTPHRPSQLKLLLDLQPKPQADFQSSGPVWDTSVQAAIRVGDWKLLTGDPGHGDWVPPQVLTTLPGRWWNLERASSASSSKTAANKNIWLFNITEDPYERWDLADQRPDVVQVLLDRLVYYNQTAVPVHFPPDDPRANPDRHGGAWVPWVDDGEEEDKQDDMHKGVYKKGKNRKKKKRKKKCKLCKLRSFFMKLNTRMMSNRI